MRNLNQFELIVPVSFQLTQPPFGI
jgi:hypothetical protein